MARITCGGCKQEVAPGQLLSHIQVSKKRSHYGHYLCVVKLLGPELTLKAIQKGLLPSYDPATLIDGKLPKFAKPAPKPPPMLVSEESN